jgi:ribosome maturation factor RimP
VGTEETVERVVAPVLSRLGLELVDVESHPGHLRVTIDRDAGHQGAGRPGAGDQGAGLDLDAISDATAAVSRALDEADAVPGGRYELEVTSPGLERRLRRPEHYSRCVGSVIAVRLRSGVAEDGERRFEGRLAEADLAGILLEVASDGTSRRVTFADIERAHTVFDWRAALAGASLPARGERRRPRPSAAERSRAAAVARAATATTDDERNDDRDVTEAP